MTTLFLVDTVNLTGYAQVLEEHETRNSELGTAVSARVYAYGHDLISQQQFTGSGWALSFFGYDGHGNTRFLTDANANVTDTYDYDAFGNLTARTGTTANHYLFTGEQYDPDLGLYFLRARYQNTQTGRFWTMDEFEVSSFDPATLHKYLYCSPNPVDFLDPSGNITLYDVQMAIYKYGTLASIAIYNGLRYMGSVARQLTIAILRPLFELAGRMPTLTRVVRGQSHNFFDRFLRFFSRPTASYPGVGDSWFGALLKRIPGVNWQQHHVAIQRAWWEGANPWYPPGSLANFGLMRLGNAGFNLLAIPGGLNNALGRSGVGTLGFAAVTYSTVAWGAYTVYELIDQGLDEEDEQ